MTPTPCVCPSQGEGVGCSRSIRWPEHSPGALRLRAQVQHWSWPVSCSWANPCHGDNGARCQSPRGARRLH